MNGPMNSRLPGNDDTRFDRLVDGQLSAEEYRALVASLDDEPGGWRRCALAFLEAQVLGQELVAIRRDVTTTAPSLAASRSAKSPIATIAWKHYLAMAASLLVALALGLALPPLWRWSAPPDVGPPTQIVGRGPAALQPPAEPDGQPRAVASARLVVSGPGGVTEAGELPIYELSGSSGDWLDQQALPLMLLDELARRGHRVERQQQYVPVDLGDGRRAVIPVEAIQITPVSRRAY